MNQMITRPKKLMAFALLALIMAFVIPVAGHYWPSSGGEAVAAEVVERDYEENMPVASGAAIAPCAGDECSEGCTGGEDCHAFAKCEEDSCQPTEKP